MNPSRMLAGFLIWFSLFLLMPHPAQGYYNASMGRWLSRDPLGESAGLNFYEFVDNDPVQGFDPDGRLLWGCAAKRPCCIVRWRLKKAIPYPVGRCVYIADFIKADPVVTAGYPGGCCPATGKGTPFITGPGAYTVYDDRSCFTIDPADPPELRIDMFKKTDPAEGEDFT